MAGDTTYRALEEAVSEALLTHGQFNKARKGSEVQVWCTGCKEVVLSEQPGLGHPQRVREAERRHVTVCVVRSLSEEGLVA